MAQIELIEDPTEVRPCFSVLSQLRPDMTIDEFTKTTQRLYESGYRLVSLTDAENVQAVAGFHTGESYAWKKYLYVDDLVTNEGARSKGYGKQLINWIKNYADSISCDQLHLDSGVARHAAHKFYLNNGFIISSYHFACRI